MPKPNVKTVPADRLRSEFEALPGVRRAIVDGSPLRVHLICETDAEGPPIDAAARLVLTAQGMDAEETRIDLAYLDSPQTHRRVRFVGLDLQRPHVGIIQARVQLDWTGDRCIGEAEGEGGSAGEIRVCAQAAVRALEAVLKGEVTFVLVGTKAIRIFDNDLVAVLLHCPQAPDRRLIGVSLVTADPNRAASLAVLNATNRLLGNYLATPD